jgi:tryptophanyl-tRNA synthetase
MHQVYSDDSTCDWVQNGCRSAGIGCLDCKKPLIDAIIEEQKPLHERARDYEENPDLVRSILQEGRDQASDAARDTLEEVRTAMGLSYR